MDERIKQMEETVENAKKKREKFADIVKEQPK
jgi:hypothetical protein